MLIPCVLSSLCLLLFERFSANYSRLPFLRRSWSNSVLLVRPKIAPCRRNNSEPLNQMASSYDCVEALRSEHAQTKTTVRQQWNPRHRENNPSSPHPAASRFFDSSLSFIHWVQSCQVSVWSTSCFVFWKFFVSRVSMCHQPFLCSELIKQRKSYGFVSCTLSVITLKSVWMTIRKSQVTFHDSKKHSFLNFFDHTGDQKQPSLSRLRLKDMWSIIRGSKRINQTVNNWCKQ